MDGDVAASHLHLDGYTIMLPPFILKILLTLHAQALWPALQYFA